MHRNEARDEKLDETKLDSYLTKVDRRLTRLPAAPRYEIISEVRSHIAAIREKDPERSISTILRSLGRPKQIADRRARERGFRTGAPRHILVALWLGIGGFAFVASLAGLIALAWNFPSLATIDEAKEELKLFGGLVQIPLNDLNFDFDFSKTVTVSTSSRNVKYRYVLDSSGVKLLELGIQDANLGMEYDKIQEIRLECSEHALDDGEPTVVKSDERLKLSLTHAGSCLLKLPAGFESLINVQNGNVDVSDLSGPLAISVENGQVHLGEAQDGHAHYDLTVENGHVGSFQSSDRADAIKVSVNVGNGSILKF